MSRTVLSQIVRLQTILSQGKCLSSPLHRSWHPVITHQNHKECCPGKRRRKGPKDTRRTPWTIAGPPPAPPTCKSSQLRNTNPHPPASGTAPLPALTRGAQEDAGTVEATTSPRIARLCGWRETQAPHVHGVLVGKDGERQRPAGRRTVRQELSGESCRAGRSACAARKRTTGECPCVAA